MQHFKYVLIFIVLIFSTIALSEEWEHLYTQDNLEFYSKQSKDRPGLLRFKARGILEVELEQSLAIMRDVENTPKWDSDTILKQTIKDISDLEALTYSESKIPWPFQNRDLVMRNILEIDEENKLLVVTSKSIQLPSHPDRKKKVRAHVEAIMKLRPHGDFTKLELEVLVDPRGKIPHWLVNWVQKKMPYNFLKGIENYGKKNKVLVNAGVKKMSDRIKQLLKNDSKVADF
jgi:hypothetical protein